MQSYSAFLPDKTRRVNTQLPSFFPIPPKVIDTALGEMLVGTHFDLSSSVGQRFETRRRRALAKPAMDESSAAKTGRATPCGFAGATAK
jgi:hypothetical protein